MVREAMLFDDGEEPFEQSDILGQLEEDLIGLIPK